MTTPREQLAKLIDDECERSWNQISTNAWDAWCKSHDTYIGTEPEAENTLCPTAFTIADAIIAAGWTPPPPDTHNPTTNN